MRKMLKLVPKPHFEKLVKEHKTEFRTKSMKSGIPFMGSG
jgi:hypothetical protein